MKSPMYCWAFIEQKGLDPVDLVARFWRDRLRAYEGEETLDEVLGKVPFKHVNPSLWHRRIFYLESEHERWSVEVNGILDAPYQV